MNRTELERAILQELDIGFGQHGFTRSSDSIHGHAYYRACDGIRHSIGIVKYDRQACLEIDLPSVGIRIDDLENLLASLEEPTSLIEERDIQVRATLGLSLEPQGLRAVFRKSWLICGVEEVSTFARKFVGLVISKGQPFWDRFSDPKQVLEVLSEETESSSKYAVGSDAIRAQKAIALTFILNGATKARQMANLKVADFEARDKNKTANEVRRWAEKLLHS